MSKQDHWTTYEAKARFSELLKQVREGRTITVTYRGEPVAEVRPLAPSVGMAARIQHLRSRGILSVPDALQGKRRAIAQRPGALVRFMEERE